MSRLKGSGLRHIWLGLRAHGARAAAQLPPRLHSYLAEDAEISVAEWYPEDDAIEMLRAWARLEGLAHPAGYGQIGRGAAQADVSTIYRSLLREGDPVASVRKIPVFWSSYQDTGRLLVQVQGDAGGTLTLTDQGSPTREMCAVFQGYVCQVLDLAGARDVEVAKESCRVDAAPSCFWRFKFRAPN